MFLYEFLPEFKKIFEGVNIHLIDRNKQIRIRGVLLTGSYDLPEKSLFLNFSQYNGRYGCPSCY